MNVSFVHKLEVSPSHDEQFCSTWGNYHFKTFDGDLFQLPSTCNYVLASHCKSSFEDFNIQLQRQEINGVTTIKKVAMKLDGAIVELTNASIKVNYEPWVCFDNVTFHYQLRYWLQWWLMFYRLTGLTIFVPSSVTIPFSQVGISITRTVSYVKIEAKLGLVIMWNEEDSLWVRVFIPDCTLNLMSDIHFYYYFDNLQISTDAKRYAKIYTLYLVLRLFQRLENWLRWHNTSHTSGHFFCWWLNLTHCVSIVYKVRPNTTKVSSIRDAGKKGILHKTYI